MLVACPTQDEEVNKALNDPSTSSKAGTMAKIGTMKYLISQAALGNDMSRFYPGAVKNVITTDFELKKLVYTFCVLYADASDETAELALLAINAFQRDLSARNPVIRGLALRVLTSIPVADIAALQLMAIKTAVRDSSPYVRKLAALALPKLPAAAVEDSATEIEEVVGELLNDGAVSVLPAAISAFMYMTPGSWHLLDAAFRRLCKVLPDVDEWGQVDLLNVLAGYARQAFCKPQAGTKLPPVERKPKKQQTLAFYSDDEGESSDVEDSLVLPGTAAAQDHDLLTNSALRLCRSQNAAVITAVAELYFYAGLPSPARTRTVTGSLVRTLVMADSAVSTALLHFLAGLIPTHTDALRTHWKAFVPAATELRATKLIKLRILSRLASQDNSASLLREWTAFMTDPDAAFVCAALDELPHIVQAAPSSATKALRGLLALVDAAPGEELVTHAITSIRVLLEQQQVEPATLQRITRLLGTVTDQRARAAIIRIVGTHRNAEGMTQLLPDALRLLARGFVSEHSTVKCQILQTARLVGCDSKFASEPAVAALVQFLRDLALADCDVHVQDSGRLMALKLDAFAKPVVPSSGSDTDTCPMTSLPGAPLVEVSDSVTGSTSNARLGTLSSAVGRLLPLHVPLAAWRTSPPDDEARDPEVAAARAKERKAARMAARRAVRADSSASSSSEGSSSGSESGSDSGSDSDGSSSAGSDSESDAGGAGASATSSSDSESDDGETSCSDSDSD